MRNVWTSYAWKRNLSSDDKNGRKTNRAIRALPNDMANIDLTLFPSNQNIINKKKPIAAGSTLNLMPTAMHSNNTMINIFV